MSPDTPQTLLRKIAEYANGDDSAEWARFVELYTPVIHAFIGARGGVATDGPEHYQTSIQKVFTAGDMHRGQSLVVWNIVEGRGCAREVDEFLMGYTSLREQ